MKDKPFVDSVNYDCQRTTALVVKRPDFTT